MPKKGSKIISKNDSYSKQLKAIKKVSDTIASDLYLEDILKLIVTVTAEVMNSKICSLMLLDENTNELVIRTTQSISDAYIKKPSIKIGEGIAGKVVKLNKPITILDVTKEKEYKYKAIAKKEGLKSLLSVPLAVKGKVIGTINNYTSTLHKFTQNEIDVLTTVANQAAVAIENTRLVVKSKIIQEELKTRKMVERAKGILMKEQNLSEEEAFHRIQKSSMNSRKSMREIAEAIILASEIKK